MNHSFAILFTFVFVAFSCSSIANATASISTEVSSKRWTNITFAQLLGLIEANELEGLAISFEQVDASGNYVYDGKYRAYVWRKPLYSPNDLGGKGLFTLPLKMEDGSKLNFEFSPSWQENGPFFLRKIKVRSLER